MKKVLDKCLVKALIDIAVFLEFTDSDLLDADLSVQMMESLAKELQNMDKDIAILFLEQIQNLTLEYDDESVIEFIRGLPEAWGLSV